MSIEDIFVEQAEYIKEDSFKEWYIEHPNEKIIIKKLSQGGGKLIKGPRGCGKTTLMLKTYYSLCSSNRKKTLGIYVNFKTSLKIEPLYRRNTNATYWFNQWILLKIYQGIYNTLDDMKITYSNNLIFTKTDIIDSINKIELGLIEKVNEDVVLNNMILEEEIKKVLEHTKKNHCVLLLDDAAHAFSVEQQQDFFEFFRQIKSRNISPKAAIYPGITNFSSTFHIGHDAEEIDVWIKPEANEYLDFMYKVLERRLNENVFKEIKKEKDLLDIMCYSSFGVTRSLLNMTRHCYDFTLEEDLNIDELKFTRKNIDDAIKMIFTQSLSLFRSLGEQFPIYKEFIYKGEEIFIKSIEEIKEYNKHKTEENQSVTLAINKPVPQELLKVLDFFQYSGLIMNKRELSKGSNGIYELYDIHYAALVEKNAFKGKKSISSKDLAICLKLRNAHSFKRISPNALVGSDDIKSVFPLSLPPCEVCNTPRISPDTKFCGNCGTQLTVISIFEELVSKDISELPLTDKRVSSIKNNSSIRTIKDILMDSDKKELRGVPQIGAYWAKKIYSYAEEYIG